MNPAPKSVALLAYPECSASVVYGMYDLFMSAGRDWDVYAGNPPGPQLMQPRIVAAEPGGFAAATAASSIFIRARSYVINPFTSTSTSVVCV